MSPSWNIHNFAFTKILWLKFSDWFSYMCALFSLEGHVIASVTHMREWQNHWLFSHSLSLEQNLNRSILEQLMVSKQRNRMYLSLCEVGYSILKGTKNIDGIRFYSSSLIHALLRGANEKELMWSTRELYNTKNIHLNE